MTSDAERRAKDRERQRRYRARKRAEQAAEVVRELPAPPERDDDGDGPTVTAVRAELDRLPAAARRPGLAATAVRLAEVLDDPTATPQAPSAARALHGLLEALADGEEDAGGTLTRLRAQAGGHRAG